MTFGNRHTKPFAIGLNCALGAPQMKPFLQRMSQYADTFVFCYPNAGLPNAMGGYDDTPAQVILLIATAYYHWPNVSSDVYRWASTYVSLHAKV
jgi:methionine synthase I (cobalamin-dependent)